MRHHRRNQQHQIMLTACLQALQFGVGLAGRNIGQRGRQRVDQFVKPGDGFVEGEFLDVFADQP
jgi:hypothetical protein